MEKIPLALLETLGAAFGKDWRKLSFQEIKEGYRLYCDMLKQQGLQAPNIFQFSLAFEIAKKRKTEQKRAPLFSSLYYELDEIPKDLFPYFLKCQGPGLLPTLWAILITHFRDKSFTIFLGHLLFASFYRTHLQLQFDRPDEQAYLRQNCLKVDQEKGRANQL